MPRWRLRVLIYDLIFLAVMAGLAVAYLNIEPFQKAVDTLGMAAKGMWFGALGGIVISLKGVYEHPDTAPDAWSDRFNFWHVGRPISGAITGLMTYFLLLVLNSSTAPAEPILYAGAFILGTQERRFFQFLYEVGRLILQVPNDQPAAGLHLKEITPSQGPVGTVVMLRGQGFATGAAVSLGTVPLGGVTVAEDGTAAAGVVQPAPAGAPLPAGGVDVRVANPDGTSAVLEGGFTYQ